MVSINNFLQVEVDKSAKLVLNKSRSSETQTRTLFCRTESVYCLSITLMNADKTSMNIS